MRFVAPSLSLLCGLALVTGACSSHPSSTFPQGTGGASGDGGGGGQSDTGTAGAPAGDAGSLFGGDASALLGGDAGPSDDCGDVGKFIYVISDTPSTLYTFDPTKFPSASAFQKVGPVDCDGSGVNSMAVDRSGVAWVNFNSGAIYEVTTTAPVTCTPTSFQPGQAGFTGVLGMGFSANSAGSSDETLFVSDNAGPGGTCSKKAPGAGCRGLGLGTIDLATMTLTRVGASGYTGVAAGYNAELTGTGEGQVYGFFTTSPATYGPISKTEGTTTTPPPTALPSVNASTGGYAFSFWGGDFYFYTAPSDNTVVTHLETATATTTTSPMLDFTIVGAGVSTCAPTVPPVQ
jgi:hypothetical protein